MLLNWTRNQLCTTADKITEICDYSNKRKRFPFQINFIYEANEKSQEEKESDKFRKKNDQLVSNLLSFERDSPFLEIFRYTKLAHWLPLEQSKLEKVESI